MRFLLLFLTLNSFGENIFSKALQTLETPFTSVYSSLTSTPEVSPQCPSETPNDPMNKAIKMVIEFHQDTNNCQAETSKELQTKWNRFINKQSDPKDKAAATIAKNLDLMTRVELAEQGYHECSPDPACARAMVGLTIRNNARNYSQGANYDENILKYLNEPGYYQGGMNVRYRANRLGRCFLWNINSENPYGDFKNKNNLKLGLMDNGNYFYPFKYERKIKGDLENAALKNKNMFFQALQINAALYSPDTSLSSLFTAKDESNSTIKKNGSSEDFLQTIRDFYGPAEMVDEGNCENTSTYKCTRGAMDSNCESYTDVSYSLKDDQVKATLKDIDSDNLTKASCPMWIMAKETYGVPKLECHFNSKVQYPTNECLDASKTNSETGKVYGGKCNSNLVICAGVCGGKNL